MHKRIFIYLMLSCMLLNHVYGQSKDIAAELYKASTIPDSLKKDANAVVRYTMENDIVKGPGKWTYKIHTLVTILNDKADDMAQKILFYNKKYSNIDAFEMLIYDADGKLLKKYHKGDLYEGSAVNYETLVSDDRFMAIRHTVANYPATVEMIYEITDNSLIDLGQWRIQEPEQAVQNSSFSISVSSDAGFRYLNRNNDLKPIKTTVNSYDTYIWQVNNLKAIKLEGGALSWKQRPDILFTKNSFEYLGKPGDMSTWANFGKWIQNLNGDVCTLSPQRVEEIKQMTADLKTDKEKAKFLYEYMQKNTRYISIQLGIGGFKPLPATFVDQKKYGDCKALSNYMYALLKAVNIPANYAIINAGINAEPANPEFPYNYFNHAILCVPFKGDTTWLECTSTTNPFGKLGTFTENRNALLITEDGGKLVRTPKSTLQDNQFNSEVHLTLAPDGGAKAQVKILTSGEYRWRYLGLGYKKTDDQKKALMEDLNLKQPSIFEFKPADDKNGIKELDIDLEYDRFCDIATGDKLFYHPRVFDLWRLTVPPLEKRKTDYYFEHPMQKTCITTIDLPQGFEVESMPANTSLMFTYGNFDINYVYDAAKNQIISTAKFNLTNYAIPAAKYNEMQQYMDDIAKVQNKKLVIRKKA